MLDLPHIVPEYANANCSACRLNCNSRLQIAGKGKRRILVLFDTQDAIQQTTKTYFCGARYTYVRNILYKYGITTDDFWVTSTIQCYTDSPEEASAVHCKPNLIRAIKQLKPLLIIGFGELTAKSLLSYIIEDGVYLDRVHGLLHVNRELGCNVMCTYTPHPSSYKGNSIEDFLIQRDIHIAVKSLSVPARTWKEESACVRILSEKQAREELLIRINDKTERVSALDYETNALKPYNKNSKIVSCAVSENTDDSFAFELTDGIAPLLREYWQTEHITKIAHNSAFERTWTIVKLGVVPAKLTIDTMLLAHAMDNRDKWLSIKFLAPMLTGCPIWNNHIESYLHPTKQDEQLYGEYAINRISSIPVRQLLMYNGIDSLVELRVFYILRDMLKNYYSTFPTEETITQ